MVGPLRYFHGGVPGLRPGDVIAPAAHTDTRSVSGDAGAPYLRSRVYITTSEVEARDYAKVFVPMAQSSSCSGLPPIEDLGGAVYEVEPRGALEQDRDPHGRGNSWEVAEAAVLRVVDPRVMPDFAAYMPAEHAAAAALQWLSRVGGELSSIETRPAS